MKTGPGATFPPPTGGARRWMRRATGLLIAVGVAFGGACGDSRGANQSEETVPRITLPSTVPTIPTTAATTTSTTTTVATTTVATTAPTLPPPPPTPWPTSLRTDPPTSPPLTNASTVPATSPQFVAATSPPLGPPGPTDVILPDSTGERVLQLQTALVAEGYQISVDGTYGPRTQAAVRDFQTRNGLASDGIAGPQTQAALGIGLNGQAPPTPTWPTSVTTTPTSATVPSSVVGAGSTADCSAAAIGADVGRAVDVIAACRSGWAIGQINDCAVAPCPTVDVFHFTDQGWMYDRKVAAGCAEELHDAGMSAYTAGDFAAWCGVPNLPVQRLVIRPGSAGVAVTQLQIALVALGYPIAVDGTYGPGTEAAIRDFQSRNGLGVDGIAGPDTRTALGV